MTDRFAIYFMLRPIDPVYQLASTWLSYDLWSGQTIEQSDSPFFDNIMNLYSADTISPRQYGFHATLKPPFRLKQGEKMVNLDHALQNFSRQFTGFKCNPLSIQRLGQFVALRPEKPSQKLNKLAEQCVKYFDRFRAPLTQAEIKKHKPERLSKLQKNYLERWGYPFVCDEFQFHMTLSNKLQNPRLEEVSNYLRNKFSTVLGKPLAINQLCLCHQIDSEHKFRVIEQYSLSDPKKLNLREFDSTSSMSL